MPLTPKPPSVNTVVTTRSHRGGEERSTVVTGNDATVAKARRRLEIPAPESENERVPMSEEFGENLLSQGYNSDGFILDFDIDTDMHLLNDYNSK